MLCFAFIDLYFRICEFYIIYVLENLICKIKW